MIEKKKKITIALNEREYSELKQAVCSFLAATPKTLLMDRVHDILYGTVQDDGYGDATW